MMIGPEPIIITLLMSSRFGMALFLLRRQFKKSN